MSDRASRSPCSDLARHLVDLPPEGRLRVAARHLRDLTCETAWRIANKIRPLLQEDDDEPLLHAGQAAISDIAAEESWRIGLDPTGVI